MRNLFEGLPLGPSKDLSQDLSNGELAEEQFTELLTSDAVRIERIVSQGHSSPESGWYCQQQSEWVMVVQGAARIAFDDGSEVSLASGDHVLIDRQRKHRVSWTDPDQLTLWLAVFF